MHDTLVFEVKYVVVVVVVIIAAAAYDDVVQSNMIGLHMQPTLDLTGV